MDTHKEILQRVVRIESRICRLGEAFGLGLRANVPGLRLGTQTDTSAVIHTPTLDIALSQIEHFLTANGIEGKVALIYYRGALKARIYPHAAEEEGS